MTAYIVTAAVLLTGLGCMLIFNSLVRARNRAAAAWAQIDVQLKRRHDLIPNLVRVVERYLEHERDVLTAVTRARQRAVETAGDIVQRAQAESILSGSLRSLYAVIETYPNLKAVTAVRDLIEQLVTAESRIAFARQHYNDSAAALNNLTETFPHRFVASSFGFARSEFFRMEDPEERRAPAARP